MLVEMSNHNGSHVYQPPRSHDSLPSTSATVVMANRRTTYIYPASTSISSPSFQTSYLRHTYPTIITSLQQGLTHQTEPLHKKFQSQQITSKPQRAPTTNMAREYWRECPHTWAWIKSDTSLLLWNCQHCSSGPHWTIKQCDICKIRFCQTCSRRKDTGKGVLNTEEPAKRRSGDPGPGPGPYPGPGLGPRGPDPKAPKRKRE